jgi:hypothetical protein
MDPSIEESQLREISNRIREQLKIKTNLTFKVESMGLISAEETPPPSLFWKLCRNSGNAMVVILNPSPVILSPFASLRVNSAKNLTQGVILKAVEDLMSSFAWLRAGSVKNLIKSTR